MFLCVFLCVCHLSSCVLHFTCVKPVSPSNLDKMLFVPVCTIDPADMLRVVLKFPSFGEVQELGGPGPSIDALYAEVSDFFLVEY